MRKRCEKKGHRWRQEVAYVLGYQKCSRWGCDARRIDPMALPPWDPESSHYEPGYDQQAEVADLHWGPWAVTIIRGSLATPHHVYASTEEDAIAEALLYAPDVPPDATVSARRIP
jgi:hypothetical protein